MFNSLVFDRLVLKALSSSPAPLVMRDKCDLSGDCSAFACTDNGDVIIL